MSCMLSKLKQGLVKTRSNFVGKIEELLTGYKQLDEDFFEDLEELLIGADLGVETSMGLVEELKAQAQAEKISEGDAIIDLLKAKIEAILSKASAPLALSKDGLTVVLVVGVNGAGKTTSIAKLAHLFKEEGKKVMLAAGDTFRAAAREQLEAWAQDLDLNLISQAEGADPASVAFDALQSARSKKMDLLIVDTAGRLHTKVNLMEEIKKMKRVLERECPGAPHETLLVVDAATGQNAVEQARLFHQATGLTGIILSKLDGSAKGGVVVAIADKLDIPVKLVGLGEKKEDLDFFDAKNYTDSLFSD